MHTYSQLNQFLARILSHNLIYRCLAVCSGEKNKPTTIEWIKHNTVVSKEKMWLYYLCHFLYVVNVSNMIACCAHNLTVKIIIAAKLNNAAVCLHVHMIKGEEICSLGRFSIYSMMMLLLLINAVLKRWL